MPPHEYFIGLLSGTSIDAVDAVLIDFAATPARLVGTHSESISSSLRDNILRLCADVDISLSLLGETDVGLGHTFALAVNRLLEKTGVAHKDILAIGSHGQTIKHQPTGTAPFTLQIGDPNTIATRTGISTVADFRRRDMAQGGQGAPLAPLFHQDFFATAGHRRAILNVGGIANISLLRHGERPLVGFDTGPGNVLMDSWISLKQGKAFDHNGAWAQQGQVHTGLLSTLLQEPYLALAAPKSTGRELFNLPWLEQHLRGVGPVSDEDVQATLLEFTARTVVESVSWKSEEVSEVLVCGGGAHNGALMGRLQALLPALRVCSSAEAGLDPQWVEGFLFAWLARKTWFGEAIDTRDVTGARAPCILGGLYEVPSD